MVTTRISTSKDRLSEPAARLGTRTRANRENQEPIAATGGSLANVRPPRPSNPPARNELSLTRVPTVSESLPAKLEALDVQYEQVVAQLKTFFDELRAMGSLTPAEALVQTDEEERARTAKRRDLELGVEGQTFVLVRLLGARDQIARIWIDTESRAMPPFRHAEIPSCRLKHW